MSRQYSPFAALSSREQQERWLEFQNTKLPYIQGDVEPNSNQNDEELIPSAPPKPLADARPDLSLQSFQQTRHKQYDAIIHRMTQAAQQTAVFETTSFGG